MYTVSGAYEGPISDDMRPCVLLAMRDRLVEGTAHVSFVQAKRARATCAAPAWLKDEIRLVDLVMTAFIMH